MEEKSVFEIKVSESLKTNPIDPSFANRLQADLHHRERDLGAARRKPAFNWSLALVPLVLAAILIFAIGPNKVLAQLQTWLGFVPGAGLVESNQELRVLAEPAFQTRDGITVQINKAFITPQKSSFEVEALNIPFESHFSQNPGQPVCNEQPYLLLPDGSKLTQEMQFAPIPAGIDQATYVIPCFMMRTLGKAPENWELPVKFAPAPADFPVYAYSLPEPGVTYQRTAPEPSLVMETATEPGAGYPIIDAFDILLTVEKPDAWLIGYGFKTKHLENYQEHDLHVVTDAHGKEVAINWIFPEMDAFYESLKTIANANASFSSPYYAAYRSFELPKGDYAFPLTFESLVTHTAYYDLPHNMELFTFDAGSNPQPGDVFAINQTVKLGDYEAKILTAQVYDNLAPAWIFEVDGGEDIFHIDLTLLDYAEAFGIGGYTDFEPPYRIETGGAYSPLPSGLLRVGLRQGPRLAIGTYIIRGTWSPEP